MPELPEVQTTVNGINVHLVGLTIKDVWTDYNSAFHKGKKNIKDTNYFTHFKKEIVGAKIEKARRRAKNILIDLSNGKTILIHMKMTGHLLYGPYVYDKKTNIWKARDNGPLADPFNKFIHLVFSLSNGKELAFSDMRKFAKVFVEETAHIDLHLDLSALGPEPLGQNFTFDVFYRALIRRPNSKIKQILMDQKIIAGIGNIYSDELLWLSNIHPLSTVSKLPRLKLKRAYEATIKVLKKGIDFGGDSMSDYRNLEGERGMFQHAHNAYRLTGKICKKKGCGGKIEKIKVGGRSGHFCNKHQEIFK
jgi:formamidopyrimidine-DNA glycosylase